MIKMLKIDNITKTFYKGTEEENRVFENFSLKLEENSCTTILGANGCGDSDIMMTDTINPLKSKFKGFHKTFKQDDLGLSLSSFLLN